MRILNKKKKRSQVVKIPTDLHLYLNYVSELIGSKDDLATIESDDLIQSPCAYGGLTDSKNKKYRFTYFPGKGVENGWFFELNESEILNLSAIKNPQLFMWECQDPECQSLFHNKNEACFKCDYIEDKANYIKLSDVELEKCKVKEDIARLFIEKNPGVHSFDFIEYYNSQYGLGDKYGWFSTYEVEQLLEANEKKKS